MRFLQAVTTCTAGLWGLRPFGVGAGWWQRISAACGLPAEPEHCVSTKANQINGWKNRQRKMKRRGFGPFGISIRLLEMGRVQASSQILHFGFLRSVFMEVPPQPLQVGSGWYSGAPGGTGLPRVPLLPCATWAASSTDCQPPGPGGDSEPRAPGVFLPPFVIAAQPSARRGGTRTQTRLVQPAHGHGRGHWGHKQRVHIPVPGPCRPPPPPLFPWRLRRLPEGIAGAPRASPLHPPAPSLLRGELGRGRARAGGSSGQSGWDCPPGDVPSSCSRWVSLLLGDVATACTEVARSRALSPRPPKFMQLDAHVGWVQPKCCNSFFLFIIYIY
nr:dual specificity mitogen-activated protein kinase kinase 6 isoform X3 [Anas platyrhynchos]